MRAPLPHVQGSHSHRPLCSLSITSSTCRARAPAFWSPRFCSHWCLGQTYFSPCLLLQSSQCQNPITLCPQSCLRITQVPAEEVISPSLEPRRHQAHRSLVQLCRSTCPTHPSKAQEPQGLAHNWVDGAGGFNADVSPLTTGRLDPE